MNEIQNKFSAYLLVAVVNKRMQYVKKKKRLQRVELAENNLNDKKYEEFAMQYKEYYIEQTAFVLKNWERYYEWMNMTENKRLLKSIRKLKEHERRMLFARVFGELTFEEMAERFDMKPKQAEMAFYYILRKLRKELEVSRKDEF